MAVLDRNEADMAAFRRLKAETPAFRFATRLPKYLSRDPFLDLRPHFSMGLTGGYEEALRGLSPRHRRQLRQVAKHILADHLGEVQVRCFRAAGELEIMFCDVDEIARKTGQRARGSGFMATQRMRQNLELAARMGRLRTDVLYIAGKPCAYHLGSLYRGVFYSHLMGCDPEYSRYFPETFLLVRTLEDLCRENVKKCDFGTGGEEYKTRLGNCHWQDGDVYLFAGGLLGMSLRTLRMMTRMAAGLGKWSLGVTGMTPRLKRAWRKQHAQDSSSSARSRAGRGH
jgi:CelD/BcsL family acetyltransferase involved in cellulose biosynthesis